MLNCSKTIKICNYLLVTEKKSNLFLFVKYELNNYYYLLHIHSHSYNWLINNNNPYSEF